MCPASARLIGDGPLLSPGRLVCHCLLVEGARGLTLIDTGYGLGQIARAKQIPRPLRTLARPRLVEEEAALRRIERLGFHGDDVRDVVVTHLDPDHAGGLPDFPRARVHVLADELDAARARPSWREQARYWPTLWLHDPEWVPHAPTGERWNGFASVRPLDGDEILMLPLPGHTRGHAAIAVRIGGRWLVHAGDAYFFRDEMAKHPRCPIGLAAFQRLIAWDNRARVENQARLRQLAREHGGEVDLFCAHDPAELERLASGVAVSTIAV